jgi:hypothetical protein
MTEFWDTVGWRLAQLVCRIVGHRPAEKMSAVICDRCRKVLRER